MQAILSFWLVLLPALSVAHAARLAPGVGFVKLEHEHAHTTVLAPDSSGVEAAGINLPVRVHRHSWHHLQEGTHEYVHATTRRMGSPIYGHCWFVTERGCRGGFVGETPPCHEPVLRRDMGKAAWKEDRSTQAPPKKG